MYSTSSVDLLLRDWSDHLSPVHGTNLLVNAGAFFGLSAFTLNSGHAGRGH